MSLKRRHVLEFGVAIAASVILPCGFFWVNYSKSGPFPVSKVGEIPRTGRLLDPMDTSGPLEYIRVQRWRNDAYYVRGFTTREAILELTARNPSWYLYNKGEYTHPREDMARVIDAFPCSGKAPLPGEHWLLEGFGDDRTFVVIDFDVASGLFYGRLTMSSEQGRSAKASEAGKDPL